MTAALDLGDWKRRRLVVLDRDGWRCATCRAPLARYPGDAGRQAHVDHVTPRALGGTNDLANLRARCGPCNTADGARVRAVGRRRRQLRPSRDWLGWPT